MSSPFSKSFLNKRSGLFMTDIQESTFGEMEQILIKKYTKE